MRKKHIRNRLFKVVSDFSESQKENPLQGLEQWDYEPAAMQEYAVNEQNENALPSLEQWEHESTEGNDPNNFQQRKHPRQDVSIYGIFDTTYSRFRTSTKNISVSGALIDPDTDLSLYEYMFVTLFHRKFKSPVRTRGKVVRVDPDGIGIQFNREISIISSL